jgi:hypothetical protein
MNSTRRTVLIQLAGGAAIAALAVTATASSVAAGSEDPIFAAIEQHRSACVAYDEAIKNYTAFEESGSEDEAAEALLNDAIEKTYQHMEYKAGGDLLETMPTTLAGIASLCRYFVPLLNVGNFGSTIELPEFMEMDGGETLTAAAAFANVIAKAVDALAVQS